MKILRTLAVVVSLSPFTASLLVADETITRGRNLSVDVAQDGRIAIDLIGDIWIVPPSGGKATRITQDLNSVQRPRWSPDGSSIVYQATTDGTQGVWVYDFATQQSRNISRDSFTDVHPDWHPSGERLVFASDTTGDGFDLWEVDLPTGLRWRLSNHPGDETDPAWSADGNNLVYIRRQGELSSLILRRRGMPEESLLTTSDRIAGPSWRPDGTVVTFLRQGALGRSIEMVILSQPRLVRPYARDENFALAPVSWLDRHRMIYSADGVVRQRLFNSWSSSPFPFQATLETRQPTIPLVSKRHELPRIDEPAGRLVIHASRMFDGVGGGYQADQDIVIEAGRISAVEPHSERPESVVINLGDLTVLPGYVDASSALPADTSERFGAFLLTTGVTTLVAEHADAERLNALWSGKDSPGPRLMSRGDWPVESVSGIADAMTPGLYRLLQSRQAQLIGATNTISRRFAQLPRSDAGADAIVLGSKGNGLPPGIALHAELRALQAAGFRSGQSLRAAGVNAAAALRVDPLLGRIAVGAVADLVFVDGDPLANVDDALNIVAVVRNGRFFSVAGLIERATVSESVD